MKAYLMITSMLLVLFTAASCKESDTPDPSPASTVDLEKTSDAW